MPASAAAAYNARLDTIVISKNRSTALIRSKRPHGSPDTWIASTTVAIVAIPASPKIRQGETSSFVAAAASTIAPTPTTDSISWDVT